MLCLFKRKCSSAEINTHPPNSSSSSLSTTSTEPPPYISDPYRISPTLSLHPRVKATSIPHWMWTNRESKTWLFLYLQYSLSMTDDEALDIVEEFEGNGSAIYTAPRERWVELLGEERGEAVYYTVVSFVRKNWNGVPRWEVEWERQVRVNALEKKVRDRVGKIEREEESLKKREKELQVKEKNLREREKEVGIREDGLRKRENQLADRAKRLRESEAELTQQKWKEFDSQDENEE